MRVSERTVYRWFDLGLIEGVRINKSLRITRGRLTLLQRAAAKKITALWKSRPWTQGWLLKWR